MPATREAEARCSDCGDRMDEGAGLALGDGLYCGACEALAACDRYSSRDGVVKGSEVLAQAGAFARLAGSIFRGAVAGSKGNLDALTAVGRAIADAERALAAARWEMWLAKEEAEHRPESHDARFARAAIAGDLPTMNRLIAEKKAAAKALEERRALDVVIARHSLSPAALAIAGACATAAGTSISEGCAGRGRIGDAPCSCPAGDAGRVDFVALTKSVMGVK